MATTIRPADINDVTTLIKIGMVAVELAHRKSCAAADLAEYLNAHYSHEAITNELTDPNNHYHIICYNGQPAGFSKIIYNTAHANIKERNVTKLDRIYLLEPYFGKGLGYALLQHNINLARLQNQAGIWLFTWTGNQRAVDFYSKAGFTIVGTHSFRVSGTHYNPNHHMYLAL